MVFKWKIVRPPFHAVVESVQVMHPSIEVEFETGSISEAFGIFDNNATELGKMFGPELMNSASELALDVGGGAPAETEKQRKAREKKEKKSGGDPSTATAPDPVTIPGTEAPPTVPAAPTTADDGIPEVLRRTPATTIAPPPPAVTAPPAPPPPPAAPSGVVAGKIIADLERRATGAADGGQALADWLATSGITVKGATYAEAIEVLRLQADEKLGPIAAQLGVA
jgi:hypothetical protein